MTPIARRRVAMSILVVFIVFIGVGLSQLSSEDKAKRVGENLSTVSFHDVTVSVPSDWSVVQLTQEAPCPPVQDRTVIVATDGLGGDCKSSKVSDSLIWFTTLSPIETAPPTTIAIGNTTGWVHQQEGANNERWVAALPQSNMQISFTGPIDAATRQSVIDSVHKG